MEKKVAFSVFEIMFPKVKFVRKTSCKNQCDIKKTLFTKPRHNSFG